MNISDIFNKCNGVLITSPHNLRYFSNFCGGEGFCLIGKCFKTIIVDSRYTVEAKEECEGFEVIEYSSGRLLDIILGVLNRNSVKTLAYEDKDMTCSVYKTFSEKLAGIELLPIGNDLDIIRSVKTDNEIELIKKAEEIGDIAFKNVIPLIKAGMTENQLAAEIEYQMRKLGGSGTSFSTIAISGTKTAMPHGIPSDKKIEKGDMITLDFGCIYNGYCSDMTRSLILGEASKKQSEIYDIVLKAQLAGLSAIKEGVTGAQADRAARSIIEGAGYGDCFGHSLGHGVGLLVHELPNLSPRSDTVLMENMVVSCEPGIYIEGEFGVRIEDLVVVKKDGIINLTSSPKELISC